MVSLSRADPPQQGSRRAQDELPVMRDDVIETLPVRSFFPFAPVVGDQCTAVVRSDNDDVPLFAEGIFFWDIDKMCTGQRMTMHASSEYGGERHALSQVGVTIVRWSIE